MKLVNHPEIKTVTAWGVTFKNVPRSASWIVIDGAGDVFAVTGNLKPSPFATIDEWNVDGDSEWLGRVEFEGHDDHWKDLIVELEA